MTSTQNQPTEGQTTPVESIDLAPILESIAKVWASSPDLRAELTSKYGQSLKMSVVKKLAATIGKLNKIGASFEPGSLSDLTALFRGATSKKEIADRFMEFEAGFPIEEILSCKPAPKARVKKVAAPKPTDSSSVFLLSFAQSANGLAKFSAILGVGTALAEFETIEPAEMIEPAETVEVVKAAPLTGRERRERRIFEAKVAAQFEYLKKRSKGGEEDLLNPISAADLRELMMG